MYDEEEFLKQAYNYSETQFYKTMLKKISILSDEAIANNDFEKIEELMKLRSEVECMRNI